MGGQTGDEWEDGWGMVSVYVDGWIDGEWWVDVWMDGWKQDGTWTDRWEMVHGCVDG